MKQSGDEEEEKPPIFRGWNQLYAAVLAFLVVVIIFFDWFTRTFNQ